MPDNCIRLIAVFVAIFADQARSAYDWLGYFKWNRFRSTRAAELFLNIQSDQLKLANK